MSPRPTWSSVPRMAFTLAIGCPCAWGLPLFLGGIHLFGWSINGWRPAWMESNLPGGLPTLRLSSNPRMTWHGFGLPRLPRPLLGPWSPRHRSGLAHDVHVVSGPVGCEVMVFTLDGCGRSEVNAGLGPSAGGLTQDLHGMASTAPTSGGSKTCTWLDWRAASSALCWCAPSLCRWVANAGR